MKEEIKDIIKNIVMIVIIFITIGVIYVLIVNLGSKAEKDKTEELKKSIMTASIECYAIEGMYPPSIEYLEDNYSIQINRDKYNVFYNGFASNMLPDITIVEVEKDEK